MIDYDRRKKLYGKNDNFEIMNVNKKCHPLFYSDVSVIFDLGHIETEVIIKR